MQELKCTSCKKKLAEFNLVDGKLSVKCKCGTTNTIEAAPASTKFIHNQPYQNRLNLVVK